MKSNLNPSIVTKLKENIPGFGGLHHLDLSNSNVGPKEVSHIGDLVKQNAQGIEGFSPLLSYDLTNNSICGVNSWRRGTFETDGFNEFVNNALMHKTSRVRKVNLSKNGMNPKAVSILGNLLLNGPNSLMELTLRFCGITGEHLERFSECLKSCRSLIVLDLRENPLDNKGAALLAEGLSINTKLKILHVSSCSIGPEGGVSIFNMLVSNSSLEVLNIGDNVIGDMACDSLGAMLKVNQRLKHLDIQENSITYEGIEAIGRGLMKNRCLAFLGLQWNNLNNECAEKLAEVMAFNNTLKAIHIYGTHIDLEGIKLLQDKSLISSDKPIDIDLSFAYKPEGKAIRKAERKVIKQAQEIGQETLEPALNTVPSESAV